MNPTDENKNREKIDRWLDAALAQYGNLDEAEPRAGLEARVLATLAADRREREQNRLRWPWRLVLAAALAVVLIAVVVARAPWPWVQSPPSRPDHTAKGPTVATEHGPKSQPPVIARAASNPPPGAGFVRSRNVRAPVRHAEAPAPRLAQFPAPRPLSEQERLLVALVDNSSPEQLAQDAAVQQRLRQETEEAQLSGGGTLEPRGK